MCYQLPKALEGGFSYADQLGQRPGAGAVYLNIFHYDVEEFLDTKKVNADEDLRLSNNFYWSYSAI